MHFTVPIRTNATEMNEILYQHFFELIDSNSCLQLPQVQNRVFSHIWFENGVKPRG